MLHLSTRDVLVLGMRLKRHDGIESTMAWFAMRRQFQEATVIHENVELFPQAAIQTHCSTQGGLSCGALSISSGFLIQSGFRGSLIRRTVADELLKPKSNSNTPNICDV